MGWGGGGSNLFVIIDPYKAHEDLIAFDLILSTSYADDLPYKNITEVFVKALLKTTSTSCHIDIRSKPDIFLSVLKM